MDAPGEDETIAEESRGAGPAEKVCATCGSTIDTSEWHPTRTDTDGEVELYLFCSHECRDAWDDDQNTGQTGGDEVTR